MFTQVTGEKLVGRGAFWPPILNRVKEEINWHNLLGMYGKTFITMKMPLEKMRVYCKLWIERLFEFFYSQSDWIFENA